MLIRPCIIHVQILSVDLPRREKLHPLYLAAKAPPGSVSEGFDGAP
jgi:hypothetical protein